VSFFSTSSEIDRGREGSVKVGGRGVVFWGGGKGYAWRASLVVGGSV